MPVSRNPSRPPSGDPSYGPDNLPVYRGGGASAPVFDPDTIFGASVIGDFYEPSGYYEDGTPFVDPADQNGDVIRTFVGGRTTAGPYTDHPDQATASFRPSVASDATHGNVSYFLGGATKVVVGLSNAALQTTLNSTGGIFGIRIKIDDYSGIGSEGFSLMGQDRTGGGLFVQSGTMYFAASSASGGISYDPSSLSGSWATIVGVRDSADSDSLYLYVNDPSTPVATGTDSWNQNRLNMGRGVVGGTTDAYQYKSILVADPAAATVSEVMSWLEA